MLHDGVTFKMDLVEQMEFNDQRWNFKVTFQVEKNRGAKAQNLEAPYRQGL